MEENNQSEKSIELNSPKWLDKGSNSAEVENKKSWMRWLISTGDLALLKSSLVKGVKLDAKDEYGYTLLHIASESTQLEIVKYLIEQGADLTAKDNVGNTPLHIAAWQVCLQVVK